MNKKMTRLLAGCLCLLLAAGMIPAAVAEDDVRKLPIDLTGGAPYKTKYSRDLEVYEDPTIRVERHRVPSREFNCTYYYALIRIADASQLRTAPADGKSFCTPTRYPCARIGKRVNAVLAINGDYTAGFSGQQSNSYVLRQGVVYRETVDERLDMLLIDEDGDFHVLPGYQDFTAVDKTVINGKKVINCFQFGPALVINGEKVPDEYILDYDHSPYYSTPDRRSQRMCIAQIGPLEYMVLCNAHFGSDLVTLRDIAMSIAPCQTVYVLDGGESAQMVFLGTRVNNVNGETKDRGITDIIYFASANFAN